MDWWTKIRLEVLRGERSKREILRREGIHWETLKKILEHPEPPGYRMEHSRPRPKIGPYLEHIAQIIEEDKALPKKQRHTAKRIYERIKEMGYEGKYTQVKEAVREIGRLRQEVFVPLTQDAGEAQVDFGHALAKVGGVCRYPAPEAERRATRDRRTGKRDGQGAVGASQLWEESRAGLYLPHLSRFMTFSGSVPPPRLRL